MAKKSKSKAVIASSENNESPIAVVSVSSVKMHTLGGAGTSTTSTSLNAVQATGSNSNNSNSNFTGIRRSIKTLDSSDSVNQETVLLEDGDGEQLPDIIVNKWSLHELKTACDDAVKQYLSKPSQFKPSHVHTDVRLTLGWTASIIALAASIYAYKVPFQQSRDWVLAAVVLYILLSGIQALYVRYIEKDTIFQGQRKVFAGRIETQALSVRSSCEAYTPVYNLHFSYTHSSNGGKSLVREYKKSVSKPFSEMFDEDGKLVRGELERTLKSVIEEAIGQ